MLPSGSSRSGPACGFTLDGVTCLEVGPHRCEPRADRAVSFFVECLVHTKSQWARRPFVPAAWQEQDILRPLFGDVTWDLSAELYVRRYRLAWIELARKQGKSELMAGVALYLLMADGEESAEIYGCAKDTKQARKVWDVAERMVKLSPVLNPLWKSGEITINKNEKRISYERLGGYYEVITADAAGELGHNPHGVIFDEVITQPDGSLWEALRTAMGARAQPLMVAATTAGSDPTSFAKVEHDECVRIAEDPGRAPHRFVHVRNTPQDADPWDENNWTYANPALGDFLSVQALRDEALEARNDPTKENGFRQFRLNQWVQQLTRWMPLHLWDAAAGMIVEDDLRGRPCFGGLDLAATTDLAAISWVFCPEAGGPGSEDDPVQVLWRAFTTEAMLPDLDRHTGGQAAVWAREGTLTVCEGEVIDHDTIRDTLAVDLKQFHVVDITYDPWQAAPLAQWLEKQRVTMVSAPKGYGLSETLGELMTLVRSKALCHGGHPVARWNADCAEVRSNSDGQIRLVKPDRFVTGKRIDLIWALAAAVDGWWRRGQKPIRTRKARGAGW